VAFLNGSDNITKKGHVLEVNSGESDKAMSIVNLVSKIWKSP